MNNKHITTVANAKANYAATACRGAASVVVALVMSLAIQGCTEPGSTGSATPVQSSARVSGADDLQAKRQRLEETLEQADAFIRANHDTTMLYRKYVETVKEQIKSCKTLQETRQDGRTPFAQAVSRQVEQCKKWLPMYEETARKQAQILQESMSIQRQVMEAAVSTQTQLQQLTQRERVQQAAGDRADVRSKGRQDTEEDHQ